MGFYEEARAVAEELIAEFGMAATVQRFSAGAPAVPGNPWVRGVPTNAPHACKVFQSEWTLAERADGNIPEADIRLLVSTEGLAITLGSNDQIDVLGSRYAIVFAKPLSPAGVIVLYDVQARKTP